jgi:hypothetical protein
MVLAVGALVGLVSLVGCGPAASEPTATPTAAAGPLSPTPLPSQIELVAGDDGSHVRYLPTMVGAAPPIVAGSLQEFLEERVLPIPFAAEQALAKNHSPNRSVVLVVHQIHQYSGRPMRSAKGMFR